MTPEVLMALMLTSPAFEAGGQIPRVHTCESRDHSPTRAQLEKAMQGHVLATAELVGTYQKSR